ncbi:hypothetical protein VB711_23680 [Cronbergia sp. UHCC 0137]|nr:hypothetical protein [Cronbergia sp. UHCC 0137]MEA5620816.1 hypothetical protein [Cronbergia sp. UHCC 0137]
MKNEPQRRGVHREEFIERSLLLKSSELPKLGENIIFLCPLGA